MSFLLRTLWFYMMVSFGLSVQAANVVVSIPPLAGLVKPLLDEKDQLQVLLQPGLSPHGFQLKPSHLKLMTQSDLLLSVGTPVDVWMDKPSAAQSAPYLRMSHLEAVQLLPLRQGGVWERHDHVAEAHGEQDADAEAAAGHSSHSMDGHLWMSWHNATLFVTAVSLELQKISPEKASAIQARTQAWLKQLATKKLLISQQLEPLQNQTFIVLHDAFQYFEVQFHLRGVGAIRLNPELAPSLKRIQQLRDEIVTSQVTCIFKEPQFPEKRVLSVVQGLPIKVGLLDPMGSSYVPANTPKGAQFVAYDVFMQHLADAFSDCLQPER